jgi:hypothetical protein
MNNYSKLVLVQLNTYAESNTTREGYTAMAWPCHATDSAHEFIIPWKFVRILKAMTSFYML